MIVMKVRFSTKKPVPALLRDNVMPIAKDFTQSRQLKIHYRNVIVQQTLSMIEYSLTI